MNRVPTRHAGLRLMRRAQRALAPEHGFTMIEVILATVIFIGVATALLGTLTSSITIHDLSRERTFGQQAATEQIECIRRLSYQDVGLYPSGNPTGRIGDTSVPTRDFCSASPSTITKSGIRATMTTEVTYTDDPGPTSYTTGANYKKATVTVTRDSDGYVLASQVTFVAPVQRAPFGGINNAILNVTVLDLALNTAVQGAAVALASGPGAPRSGTTDSAGLVSFAALLPTTSSGATTDYYDISVTKTGYLTLDIPPALPAHKQVPPTLTVPATIRVYKPATINVVLRNADGTPSVGTSTVTVTSPRGTQTYTVNGSTRTINNVIPDSYTITATNPGGVQAPAVTNAVPDDYPSDMQSTFTLTFPAVGSVAATVTWGGQPVLGATVMLSGGPNSLPPTPPTSTAGNVYTFANVPEGSGYTLTASKTTANGNGSATVNAISVVENQTTSVPVAFQTATVDVTITRNGIPVSGATVTLSGGPMGLSPITGSPPFVNVPVGSGYTIAASKSGNGGGSATSTGVTVAAPSTTVPLVFKTGTVRVSVKWATLSVPAASIRLTGPNGVDITQAADLSGVSDFTVPVGSGYSVAVVKTSANGNSNTVSAAVPGTVDDVTIVPVTVNLTPTSQVTVTVNWGTRAPAAVTALPVAGAVVTLGGGPLGVPIASVNPHTGATGQYVFTAVPAGTNYTASATKTGSTGSVSSPALINATATTTATVTLSPVGALTVTVKQGASFCSGWAVRVSAGPAAITTSPALTLTTTATGVVTFTTLPGGGGYAIRATKSGKTTVNLTNQTVPNATVVVNVASC